MSDPMWTTKADNRVELTDVLDQHGWAIFTTFTLTESSQTSQGGHLIALGG